MPLDLAAIRAGLAAAPDDDVSAYTALRRSDLAALLAEVERLRGERDEARVLLRDAHRYIEAGAEYVCYGGFHGGDPRDFHPDHECSTEGERANHAAACKAFAEAEARGEKPVLGDTHESHRDEDGRMILHVARNPYGLGTMVYRDEEATALAARIAEWRRAAGRAARGGS